jgi:hypothetical protein
MGQIADDMVDGTCCQACGQYFEKDNKGFTHGYPATCWECYDELTSSEQYDVEKAEVQTF